jgi:FkbM family methyltransferase
MGKIELKELVPPICYRIGRYFEKKLAKVQNKILIIHPFDAVPRDINVKWILDVGANVGDISAAALDTYPAANVICFEPVKNTFEILKSRMASYKDRAHLFNFALSDKQETGLINITTAHGANSIMPQAQFHQEFNPHVREISKEEIKLVRLDDFAGKFPSQKIDIMKIDVEGHELNVLKGGADFISQNVDVVIIEISLMRDPSLADQAIFEVFSFFNKIGFCLVNVMDLHHIENKSVQLVQMDCVFRKIKNIIIS